MKTFDDILALCRQTHNQSAKGTRFEQCVRSWLLSDPRFACLTHVWMWKDFPYKTDISTADTGIDLVAKTTTNDYWAIQCKCYAPEAVIDKASVDSFLATSSRSFSVTTDDDIVHTAFFSHRLWIATTNHWTSHAEEAIRNQHPPVSRISIDDLRNSPVDWEKIYNGFYGPTSVRQRMQTLAHQQQAILAAQKHFEINDRGKLIMACGTGKTFTSLRIVETLLQNKGLVLYLVPSISLLSQSLNEWTANAQNRINPICICSDSTASKNKYQNSDSPSFQTLDLVLPASTNTESITKQLLYYKDHSNLTVIFSTYQSIDVVKTAQDNVLNISDNRFGFFDFIICDEAHRTTGFNKNEEDSSAFTKIHNDDYIRGRKRLYMTATPRIYTDSAKANAKESDTVLYSMDNPQWYGEEFFHIGFSYAVEQGLLTDYKVFVMTVSEADIPDELVNEIKEDQELSFDGVSKLIGVISALSKNVQGDDNQTWTFDPNIMHRALAFCPNIGSESRHGSSKNIARILPKISQYYQNLAKDSHLEHIASVQARHVDGSMSALQRNDALQWLAQEPEQPNQCHVITNVRCLSEGIDVPALDAVIFLSTRNSQVDIVQSVGRVMRNFRKGTPYEKKYGYIIIPIIIPSFANPDKILEAGDFKTVWSVLNALRSHDDRFNAHINKIQLNNKKNDTIIVGRPKLPNNFNIDLPISELPTLNFGYCEQVIYAKLVEKVGDRMYWENWAQEVGNIAVKFIDRLRRSLQKGDYLNEFNSYLTALQTNINPSITEDQAIEMLAQHLIMQPVFDTLFKDYRFSTNNSISYSMEAILQLLKNDAFNQDTRVLQNFYDSVERNINNIDNLEGKQTVIKNLYEKFFKGAFPKVVEQLGIIYTPIECVDFIIHSVDYLLYKEFKQHLTDKDVFILDPFTGTGTFITRLLQSSLIQDSDMERKYRYEIFCNEIILLAYYIADVNIESVFHAITQRNQYLPFEGISLTDTFQMAESSQKLPFSLLFNQNAANIEKLQKLPVKVIMGNPPYSVGQKSANDNAPNQSYPHLEERIANTYVKESNCSNKRPLYDSYMKAFRWASDKINTPQGGIIAFITNGGWLDGNAHNGTRICFEKEFDIVYVYDLQGGIRGKTREDAKKAGQNIFNIMVGVTIVFLIKKPQSLSQSITHKKATIYYNRIGDYLNREQKLAELKNYKSVENVPWKIITPNDKADWIHQRNSHFDSLIPIFPDKKFNVKSQSVFSTFALGINSCVDTWVCSFSKKRLIDNVQRFLEFYNEQRVDYNNGKIRTLSMDKTKISWTRTLVHCIEKDEELLYDEKYIREVLYRPFVKRPMYYAMGIIHMPGIWRAIFPAYDTRNLVICICNIGNNKSFSCLMTNALCDFHLVGDAQCFPLYWFDKEGKRQEAVTDYILDKARQQYNTNLSKEDIFYYVYGLFHSPQYRQTYADDLRKSLPRIPLVINYEDFQQFSRLGLQLANLHLNYEHIPPTAYNPFTPPLSPSQSTSSLLYAPLPSESDSSLPENYYRVEKMRFATQKDPSGKMLPDKTTLIYNPYITLRNIPIEAYEYVINGKSAIEWIMERYAVTTDKDTRIMDNPNDYGIEHKHPSYILDLLVSVINLSIQTNRLVQSLPELSI